MLNILLYGPPGAGKGTQAEKLIEKYGLNHISTGEVIRDEIKRGTPLGKSMEEYIGRGELAPDSLVIDMIAEYVESHCDSPGNIFDGFPRTRVQAEEFDRILARHGLKVDVMLSLEVPEEVVVGRLLLRGRDSGRPEDMDEQVIRYRLSIYRDVTEVVSAYYAAQGKYVPVDGTRSVDDIFAELSGVIDGLIE